MILFIDNYFSFAMLVIKDFENPLNLSFRSAGGGEKSPKRVILLPGDFSFHWSSK